MSPNQRNSEAVFERASGTFTVRDLSQGTGSNLSVAMPSEEASEPSSHESFGESWMQITWPTD
jgi:hypothetical protein